MIKLIIHLLFLNAVFLSIAHANPTARAILSIPGSTYKIRGKLNFNETFVVSEGTIYTAYIMGNTEINYQLTHNELNVDFKCDRRYNRACGNGAIISILGDRYNIRRVKYKRSTQSFEVYSESIIPGVAGLINRNVRSELNEQLKSKMNWALNRLRTLINTKETDPAVISEAIQEFLRRVASGAQTGQEIDVPGFTGGNRITITPGRDAIVKFEELYLHFKRGQPATGALRYRKPKNGDIIFTNADAYLNNYPAQGLTVSTDLEGDGHKAKVENIFISASRGMDIQSSSAIDDDINTGAYLIGGLIAMSGGPRYGGPCCNLNIAERTIQRISVRTTQEYIRANFSTLIDVGYPRNMLNAVLRQRL